MKARTRALLALAAAPLLAGCVAYPRPYMTSVKGQADLQGGPPIKIRGGIETDCSNLQGDTEDVKNVREVTTDKDGRYSFTVFGVGWNFKSFISDAECATHVQRFVCRPFCKKADEIDINVLGK